MNNCLYLVWQHYKGFIESVLTSVLTLILCEVCVFWFVAKSFLSVLELFLANQGLCRIINWLFAVRCPPFIVRFSTWFRFPNQGPSVRFWSCTHTQTRGIWGNFLATFSKGKCKVQGQVATLQMPFTCKRKSTNFSSTHVRICEEDVTPLRTKWGRKLLRFLSETKLMKTKGLTKLVKIWTILFQSNTERIVSNGFLEWQPKTNNLR